MFMCNVCNVYNVELTDMIEFYKSVQIKCGLPIDSNLVSKWETAKEKQLTENSAKKEEAKKSEGDVEVLDIDLEKGNILRNVSTLSETMKHLDSIKNLTTGKNIDKHLSLLRLCLAWGDDVHYKKYRETTAKFSCLLLFLFFILYSYFYSYFRNFA